MPRWLEGYKLCQQLLNLTTSSAQILDNKLAPAPSPIITSQAIMVGKALILAETLMPLPTPSDFDAQRDVGRFSWLFPGSSCSSRDRPGLEIHGGCGFSTALLHRISQITYCASRLHQYADSAVVPVTAQFLYDDLANMRQWSGESMDWETAQMMPAMMERIRKLPDDYVMHSSAVMMNVTAEAWRIAAIIYLQCRVLRQVFSFLSFFFFPPFFLSFFHSFFKGPHALASYKPYRTDVAREPLNFQLTIDNRRPQHPKKSSRSRLQTVRLGKVYPHSTTTNAGNPPHRAGTSLSRLLARHARADTKPKRRCSEVV